MTDITRRDFVRRIPCRRRLWRRDATGRWAGTGGEEHLSQACRDCLWQQPLQERGDLTCVEEASGA
jgi:hypothetical protein